MIKSVLILSILANTLFVKAQNATPAFISDSLDLYINKGLKDWNIPGLAIAIVKDGKIVAMKGYGVRDIKTNEPVDQNTLFMIASNSKLFTATAISQLEYNKKLTLNDKVTRYFKDYALYDQNATNLVNIRDLLSHRIGTKTFQGDFSFWNSNLSRTDIIRKMRLLKPMGQFRQDFGYCNSCFVTAGEIIPAVSGQPWEVYVYDSLLIPLGMSNTHMLGQGISQRPNVSKPYSNQFSGKLYEVPYDQVDNLGPAGSMVSSVNDLSKWLIMQLDSGRYNGKQVLPWSVVQKTRDMNISIRSRMSSTFPTHFNGYGLGVFISDYNGRQLYYHTGGAYGFVSNTCFVPEEKLGIVILTNNDNQGFFEALRYQVLDAYLGVPYSNRSAVALAGFQPGEQSLLAGTRLNQARVKGNKPSLKVESYTGTYHNEVYGDIIIAKDSTGLKINFKSHNRLTAKLAYMDNDEWLMTYDPLVYGVFATRFSINAGKVQSITIKANDFVEYDPYIFTKK